MTRLWHRGGPLDPQIERFTAGRDPELDRQLVPYDALGSMAHATMLHEIGVLAESELSALRGELAAIVTESRAGSFAIAIADEDAHTAIENRLTAQLGDVGRRIHTGRSRNDQVLAMLRLYGREIVLQQIEATVTLVGVLLDLADRHFATSVAGYSHTRQAMPSTFGLLFAAHAEGLLDDASWLQHGFHHLNRSPLGSASGYGVALPLDRERVAQLLRFDSVQNNTLAVQNDRGKTEYLVLGAAAATVADLSRLAADLIFFSSDELRFVQLAEQVTTGSSIMPQKRNPDVLELVRATAARLRARQHEVGAVYGGLLSGYHRDLQLTKEPFLDGMQCCLDALSAMRPVLETLTIDAARCRAALQRSIGATDAVYRRVAAGEPFRSAYKAVAADPDRAVADDPTEAWRDRAYPGAPGNLALDAARARADATREWLQQRRAQIGAAWDLVEHHDHTP